MVEPGNDDPHQKSEDNGEGKGHKHVFPPGKGGVNPVIFVIRGPEDHHDENHDLQDADQLEIIEEELLAIGLVEVISDFGHKPGPSVRIWSFTS